MADHPLFDRLDAAVETMLATGEVRPAESAGREDDRELEAYVRIARTLLDLPRASFKARLKADLQGRANMTPVTEPLSAVNQTASARLRVKNAGAAIEFYKNAFAARELMRFEGRGQIAHAELAIGNSIFMLGEAAPEYGFPGPDTLGGSPVGMHLYVDDCDRWVARAVAAGARLITPVSDQFYGDRSGSVGDPFGYSWTIATHKEDMSVEEMRRRMAALERESAGGQREDPTSFMRKGFHTVTPYLVVQDAPALIAFTERVFGAEQQLRTSGAGGGIHAEVRLGDSIVMIGGGAGGDDRAPVQAVMPTALHVYVEDVDAVYKRALEAGAASIGEPTDHEYGERGAGVKDSAGNLWYIATAKGDHYLPAGLHNVNVYLHPLRAEPLIKFMERGLGAVGAEKFASPDGVVHHAKIAIGDSVVEMGEANGPYQPMPTMFYVYVPDVDAGYHRALQAGGASISQPANQSYGDRTAAVKDPFGNQWYLATALKDRSA
jgi:PhnB protein